MEKLARQLAENIGKELNADEERVAVMAYGLTALLQLLLLLLSALLLGCLFDILPQTMIVFFSVGFLRRLIGGVHSESMRGCTVMSIFCIAAFSALSRYLLPRSGFFAACIASAVIYLVSSVLIYRLAPVDSPNKPVRAPEKIKRLRRGACITMLAFAALTAAVLVWGGHNPVWLGCVWALDLSVLWQCWMLTASGAKAIRIIDRIFA